MTVSNALTTPVKVGMAFIMPYVANQRTYIVTSVHKNGDINYAIESETHRVPNPTALNDPAADKTIIVLDTRSFFATNRELYGLIKIVESKFDKEERVRTSILEAINTGITSP